MNAIQHSSFAAVSSVKPSTFTFLVNLKGPSLSNGIEVDTEALKPGIYFTSDDGSNAWVRYVALDYRDPPRIEGGKIFNAAISAGGYLVSRSGSDTSLLRIKIYDRMIRRLINDEIAIDVVSGEPVKRELVWKKNVKSASTVGFDALYEMRSGDVLVVSYPGGSRFLAYRKGQVVELGDEDKVVKQWQARRHEDLVGDQIAEAQALGEAFPWHPTRGCWNDEIDRYLTADASVKAAFLESLFWTIYNQLMDAVVDEKGLWDKADVFKMHTLYEVTRHFSKEHLSRSRALLRDAAVRQRADLPMPIMTKFGMERKSEPTIAVPKNPATSEKRRRHELNLAKRAEENRARARGGSSGQKQEQNNKKKKG